MCWGLRLLSAGRMQRGRVPLLIYIHNTNRSRAGFFFCITTQLSCFQRRFLVLLNEELLKMDQKMFENWEKRRHNRAHRDRSVQSEFSRANGEGGKSGVTWRPHWCPSNSHRTSRDHLKKQTRCALINCTESINSSMSMNLFRTSRSALKEVFIS